MIKHLLMINMFLFFAWNISAQTLYAFLIVQNDASIGCLKDEDTIKALLGNIDQKVRRLNVVTKVMNGAQANKSKIEQELSQLSISSDDVIWFFYTGHGKNYDTWPMTDQYEISLTWLDDRLRETPARLTIAMFDCCNWGEPLVQSSYRDRHQAIGLVYYDYLFLYSKGHIKVASCSSKQFAFGSKNSGSLFTNAFTDAIKENATWENVLMETNTLTETLAQAHHRKQQPKYIFSSGFLDGTFKKN